MTQRRPFYPDSQFKAGRPFVMDGVSYNYDDPVRVSHIELRRLRQMYDARMIEVADEPTAAARKPAKAAAKAAPLPDTPVVEAARGPVLKHRGFGKFEVVDAAGKVLAGPLSKEQAEREMARLT